MKFFKLISACIIILLSTGCSIHHNLVDDYDQYLINNEGQAYLPKTSLKVNYYLSKATVEHTYEYRDVLVGYAHIWTVDFGKFLESTLQSKEVQAAFEKLSRTSTKNQTTGNLMVFNLRLYDLTGFRAHIVMTISLRKDGKEVFKKTYDVYGTERGTGKIFWGGPFVARELSQETTKDAIDKILTRLINDINKLENNI